MDVENLLPDTVTIAQRAAEDVHGKPTFSAQLKVPARVDTNYALQMSLHAASDDFSHAICMEHPINTGDLVWLGSDDTTKVGRQVQRSASAYTGDNSYKLYMAYL